MRIYPFHARLPDKSVIASPSSFSDDVKEHFRSYTKKGYILQRRKEEVFAYQVKSGDYIWNGFIALLDIDEFTEGKVIPHENTLHQKEQTSMQLILEREALIKPLLLTYEPNQEVLKIIEKTVAAGRPIQSYVFEKNDERHSIWAISDDELSKELISVFKKSVDKVYIADGHHRATVLSRLNSSKRQNRQLSYNHVMSAFFDFDNLTILDYNRMVDYSDRMSALEFMVKLSQVATFETLSGAEKPKKKFHLTLYIENQWFGMKWKKKVIKSYKSKVLLDATILNDIVLSGILGIEHVESDERVKYITGVASSKDVESKADRRSGSAAFFLYPVRMRELQKQADLGKNMPPKSTFFKPRLPNGFIAQSLADLTTPE